ncbi:MAG: MucB/RseB C-terminal domain-containing protein [Immundisolibacteraceae bacterium]|nr:MucB/RseB C-terminal domain-containing protein [Immundisolibacteraceae bacterium]
MNRIWLALVCLLPLETALAQDQSDWLRRMEQAASTISYRGDFVFVRGDLMRHMRVVHLVDSEGVHQRVFSLDGPPNETLLGGGQPGLMAASGYGGSAETENLPFSTLLPQRLQALNGLYQISLGGIDRVAEHQAQVVNVEPEDGYRFGFRLWSELGSGLLLRAQMLNSTGQVIEQFSFSSVDLDAAGGSIPVAEVQLSPPQLLAPETGHLTNWRVGKIPPGFALQSMRRYAGQRQAVVDHLLFSDGLATVSVFIEPVQDGDEFSNQSVNTGIVNALTGTVSDNQVTVMGEVPVATLSMIFNSLQPGGLAASAESTAPSDPVGQ